MHFMSLQLVMEYCLGSASDLLEGELVTISPHPCMRCHDSEYHNFKFILIVFFLSKITVGELYPPSSSQETSARS